MVLLSSDLLELKRWNTPTIYNGWEQITNYDSAKDCFNLEGTTDFMAYMGPMVGYAVTVTIQPSLEVEPGICAQQWKQYREYIASVQGPKIVVVQDLDKPDFVGAFWGEVNSSAHKALGCVGTITDGCIRDYDEMKSVGFKALARRMCVGHAHSTPLEWNIEVEVFGCNIQPGQLIHADQHGFLVVPQEDEAGLLEAARFMDSNECETVLAAVQNASEDDAETILNKLVEAGKQFQQNAKGKWVVGSG